MIKKFLAAIFTAFCLFACVGSEGTGTDTISTVQAITAAPVTMPIPTESFQGNYNITLGDPPPWGFYGYADNTFDLYLPILVAPIGSVITQVQAKVLGVAGNRCELALFRMNDFEHTPELVQSLSAVDSPTTTAVSTSGLNIATVPLKKLFIRLHASGARCSVMAAEVTFTPPSPPV